MRFVAALGVPQAVLPATRAAGICARCAGGLFAARMKR